MGFILTNALLW